ncbi:conserved hypothetical protein [Kineococcus radiotolerans SRS30216 = ATCC BAA-149]|uniref:Uncharacterized protein n=1 Tax=Kineococcus radiotolerans (strain ATCC BAA-149 / DSM 14245 / SRS30216) TaxID=266940 RepID=A6WEA8_KINRD|nr:conserved hypothetical protein [Kineococcus radiotolerans SRS30216 = ATCC BAA-149]
MAWPYGCAVPASSLIFLVIVVLWAAYLVPNAIRKHRRTASARQADRDSQAMRVVVRRGSAPVGSALAAAAVNAASAHAVAGSSSRPVLGPGPRALPGAAPVPARVPAPAPVRTTSAVVRRRRRLLASVAALTALGWAAVALVSAPWGVGALPTLGLLLVVAVLSRHGAARAARPVAPAAARFPEARPTPRVVRPAARAPRTAPAAVPGPREERTSPLAGDRSWQPVAVPLPTYLLKDKAPYAVPPLPAVALVPGVDEDDVPTRVIDLRDHVRVVNQ